MPLDRAAETAGSGPVGFIGLGQIGRPLAGRLLDGGHALVVWNRTPEKAAQLAAERAPRVALAPSPAATARAVDRIVLCLLDDAAARSVIEGPEGLLAGLRPGALVLNFTTVAPETGRELARRVAERGAGYLDTPFSGLPPDAAAGTLTLFVGGAPEDVAAARDLLDRCGERVFHLGPPGAGNLAKVLNNGLGAACLVASGEALAAARAAGLDPARFVEAVLASSGGSTLLDRVKRRMLEPSPEPVAETFTLRRFREYTRLALAAQGRLGRAPALVAAADEVLARAIAAGFGEAQYTAFMLALAPGGE